MEHWLPAIVIFVYLAVVLYIGIFAFRRGKSTGEDFFLASRSIGSIVFFLSLFATNMTAFAILGSSGAAYKQGIGIFAMMATSSALVIPLTLFFIGTRLWAHGKRFGLMTQVSFFRDRWDCSFIGTIIFFVTSAMLLPYLIISIDGGGTILSSLTEGRISYPIGGAIVALIVMATVFFGGMRGAVWVNVLQTILFIGFGLVAFWYVGTKIQTTSGGQTHTGFPSVIQSMLNDPSNKLAATPQGKMQTLLTRDRIPWQVYISFMLIPLSSIMFPHMSIMCFTAKKVTAFKKTVVLYPLCIMAIWLPCVFLGSLGPSQDAVRNRVAGNSETFKAWIESGGKDSAAHPEVADFNKALRAIAAGGAASTSAGKVDMAIESAAHAATTMPANATPPVNPKLAMANAATAARVLDEVTNHKEVAPDEIARQLYSIKSPVFSPAWAKVATANSDSVLLEMLRVYVPGAFFGLLAAGIISAVMGSDCHQILGLSTMFTKDIFTYYGGGKRIGEHNTVNMGRAFILIINGIAYVIALGRPPIFDLAVTYAFSGFAALSPMMIAALFWRRSTKWGGLLCTLWVAVAVGFLVYVEGLSKISHYHPNDIVFHIGGLNILTMNAIGKLNFFSFTPVVPIMLGAIFFTIVGSLLSPPPSAQTINRYFPGAPDDRRLPAAQPIM